MKALVAHDYGFPPALSLENIPVPEPEAGQLQIRVSAAAMNRADLRLLSGELRAFLELPFPHVPGNDFAGTVTAIGDKVTGFRVGDEIFGYASPRILRPMAGPRPSVGTGSMARYMVIEADTPVITHRPETIDPVIAAAAATTGLTALAAMRAGRVQAGEKALVIGAAGGVGTALVSLLAAHGVDVIATAKPEDQQTLAALGAKWFSGYNIEDYPEKSDAIFNLALPGTELSDVAGHVRKGGRLISITMPPLQPDMIARDDIETVFVADTEGKLATMKDLADCLTTGVLKTTIAEICPLKDAAAAYVRYAQEHVVGKMVVTP